MSGPDSRGWRRVLAVAPLVLLCAIAGVVLVLVSSGASSSAGATSPVVHALPRLKRVPQLTPPPKPKPRRAVYTFVWPFYGYKDTRARTFSGPSNLDPPLRKGWHYNDFALLEFPPVIYHGDIYFMDFNGSVKAIDKRTGKRIWKRKIGTLAAVSPGIDARHRLIFAPTLSDSRGAHLPGNGRIVALGMSSGRIRWSRALPPGSESSPLVHGNSVFVGTQNGSVISFQARSGHINWVFHAGAAVKGGVAYSSGKIYFGDYASRVYAVNAVTGHEVWATTTAGGAGSFYGSPAIAFGHVFLGNTNGHVYALSKTSGGLLWDAATSAYVYSSPAVANVGGVGATVYVGSYDGDFYALSARTGAVRWRHASGSPISGSGTIVGHVIYYSLLRQKRTLGLDLRTGRVRFSFPDGEFASVIADRGAMYLIGASTIYQLLPRQRR
jgi:outer membrane protein assembly factor BamB